MLNCLCVNETEASEDTCTYTLNAPQWPKVLTLSIQYKIIDQMRIRNVWDYEALKLISALISQLGINIGVDHLRFNPCNCYKKVASGIAYFNIGIEES